MGGSVPSQRRKDVFFHHFHKAAGSSAIESLSKQYSLPAQHANGNPVSSDGRQLPIWEYSSSELRQYLASLQLENRGSLIVTEWGIPDIRVLRDEGVATVTIIREPLERLISNYKFDFKYRYFRRSLEEYVSNPAVPYQRPDYYMREIKSAVAFHEHSGIQEIGPGEASEKIFDWFDEIIVLEKGCFRKVKNADLISLAEMPKVNVAADYSRWRGKIFSKNRPNVTSGALEAIGGAMEQDFALFRLVASAG